MQPRTLTSMSRTRFMELRAGILDGSLAEKWRELEATPQDELTKRQRVELRQLTAISAIFEESPETLTRLVKEQWRRLLRCPGQRNLL